MMKKITGLFKPVKQKLHRVAIIPGHNSKSQGATRIDNGKTEYTYWNEVAKYCKEYAKDYNLEVKVFNRQHSGSYTREIEECYKRVNAWNPFVTCELHFNASSAPSARGCEVLHSGTEGSVKYARSVHAEAQRVFKLKDRGIKQLNKGDRGYQSVVSALAPSILTEFYFGSSKQDCQHTEDESDKMAYAHIILSGIIKARS